MLSNLYGFFLIMMLNNKFCTGDSGGFKKYAKLDDE